jgi:hypothetical protein
MLGARRISAAVILSAAIVSTCEFVACSVERKMDSMSVHDAARPADFGVRVEDAATSAEEVGSDSGLDMATDIAFDTGFGDTTNIGTMASDGDERSPTDSSDQDADSRVVDGRDDNELEDLDVLDTGVMDTGHSDSSALDGADLDAGSTVGIIQSTRGAACLTCAQQNCVAPGVTCEDFAGQAALPGSPAAGASRQQLCYSTLSCVLSSDCAKTDLQFCYCGSATGTSCYDSGAANGPCLSQEQNGLETTDPVTLVNRLTDPTFGGGMANFIVQCLELSQCSSCF